MQVIPRETLLERLSHVDLISRIEDAFRAYSRGAANVPPPGELLLDDPPGEVHIKYGTLADTPWIVIKVASGFGTNAARGLSTSQGLLLILDRRTGVPHALLADDGALTDLRTAVAGAIAAKWLAPSDVDTIGVIGAGIQARLQVEQICRVRPIRRVVIWNRTPAHADQLAQHFSDLGLDARRCASARDVAGEARLIVTTTSARAPVLHDADVQPGTHITAIGADTAEKCELDPQLFARAQRVVTDSIAHSTQRGELRHAIAAGTLDAARIVELGTVLSAPPVARGAGDVTIAALTGLAVQDIAIASAVLASGDALR
ncbi:MAG: hypothetical protein MUF00_10520 [Gemmatimonadaceae bacterium]|jgi:ornithine cyclodeaminase|nr:hypothetical protein [Gemmatimonadaceae bacterium]